MHKGRYGKTGEFSYWDTRVTSTGDAVGFDGSVSLTRTGKEAENSAELVRRAIVPVKHVLWPHEEAEIRIRRAFRRDVLNLAVFTKSFDNAEYFESSTDKGHKKKIFEAAVQFPNAAHADLRRCTADVVSIRPANPEFGPGVIVISCEKLSPFWQYLRGVLPLNHTIWQSFFLIWCPLAVLSNIIVWAMIRSGAMLTALLFIEKYKGLFRKKKRSAMLFMMMARARRTDDVVVGEKDQCCICLDEFGESDDKSDRIIVLKPCNHVLHATCFTEWVRSDGYHAQGLQCVVCRQNVERIAIPKSFPRVAQAVRSTRGLSASCVV